MNFEGMKSTNMDGLENETLDAMHKFGKALMQWKLQEWNTELRQETCCECGSKIEAYPKSCTSVPCVYCAPRDNDLLYFISLFLLLSVR